MHKKMNVLNAMKNFVDWSEDTSDSKTSENLLELKKELATQIVEKFESENSDFILSIGKNIVVDYLVDEGFTDKIHDAIVEKGIDAFLTSHAGKLKEWREKLGSVSTEAELQALKTEIQNGASSELVSSDSERNSVPKDLSTPSIASSFPVSETSSTSVNYPSQAAGLNLFSAGFMGFDAAAIQSSPFEKSGSGTTLCSKTAQKNAEKFGLNFPSGNARDAAQKIPQLKSYKETLPLDKKDARPTRSWDSLTIDDFNKIRDVNVADIYPDSKSKYGHRAIAFRDVSGERMVLDPYIKVGGVRDTAPKKLEDYLQTRKILKGHFYIADTFTNVA